jgi:Zn-finger nucleic acid-binding protein
MDSSSLGSGARLACPSCRTAMAPVLLDAHYGASVQLDACHACHGLWVDDRESLRLTPGSTLQLFELIHDLRAQQRRPLATHLHCARCDLRLIDTHDRQRDTPFRYWRCGRGHGRFITFFDFLREKDFVRPLTLAQVAELRAQVRSVNCSNCGAPIDLQTSSACAYCRTALSMLDFTQVQRMLTTLRDAEDRRAGKAQQASIGAALLPLALARERRHVEQFFNQIEQTPDWGGWSASSGLVEAGVSSIVALLRGLR